MFIAVVRSLVAALLMSFLVFPLQAEAPDADPAFVIEGTVTDFTGQVVEGARLEWGYWLADRDDCELVTTDENGHYRLVTNRQGPDYRLGVSMLGLAPDYRDGIIPTEQVTKVDFTLLSPISVQGILVDSAGNPLAGLRVDITSKNRFDDHHESWPSFRFPGPHNGRVTDPNGRFTIRDLPASRQLREQADGVIYNLNVRRDNKLLTSFHVSSKGENRLQLSKRELDLHANMEHFGRVIDENGEPITKFSIRDFYGQDLFPQTQSTFRYVGKYGFHIHAPGFQVQSIKEFVADNHAEPVEYRLASGETFDGRVIGRDGAIAKADVLVGARVLRGKIDWLSSIEYPRYRLQSDEDGRFSIYSPRDSKREEPLIVGAPGYCWKALDPSEWAGGVQSEIQLTPSLPIVHVMAKFAGKPAANDLFCLTHRNGLMVRGRFDESGSARVDRLPPGDYKFALIKRPVRGHVSVTVLGREFSFNETGSTKVVFENPANGLTLTGSTYPFAIVYARLIRMQGEKFLVFGTLADANGNYEITGLPPGDYCAEAWNELRTHPDYGHNRTREFLYNLESDCKLDLLSGRLR